MNQSRTRVAILIDGDNSASTSIISLLSEAEKLGEVSIRRIYGNWSLSSMHKWEKPAQSYGFEQRHHGQTSPGKNATDIALTIDAMDILYSGTIDHFFLVTSDSDYTPLVLRLRSAGCRVFVIGKQTTPLALQAACTTFVSTDQLQSKPAASLFSVPRSSAIPTPVETSPASARIPTKAKTLIPAEEQLLPTDPLARLRNAYEEVAQKQENEWVRLSDIGTTLKKNDAQFSPTVYGYKDLQALVKAYPDQFETQRQASKGKPILVRWKHIASSKKPVPKTS